MAGYYRELCQTLRDGGCYFVREGKGDHEVWFSPITGRHFTVDRGVSIKHTANGALKDAGLPKKF
jgi:hypothetical protein